MKRLVVIVGPTGSGKTDLAIEIATRLGAPIISTDSRQVYRGMKIGSAQPTDVQLDTVTHYFIADREPAERFSCADFEREALALLEKLFAGHNYVVAVGGSGLYVDALCEGLDAMPDADLELRKALNNRLARESLKPLLEELRALDPDYCEVVDGQNPARVLRALEVCLQTGKPYSSFLTGRTKSAKRPFEIIKIGVDVPREELYRRIDQRVDEMMAAGLEGEARELYPLGDLPALRTVGYRELFDYFAGKTDLARAVELIKRNSRRYAKRQMTWFGRDENIRWFAPARADEIMEFVCR